MKKSILLVIVFLFGVVNCSSKKVGQLKVNEINFFAMNTYNTVTVYDDASQEVLESIEDLVNQYEKRWSVTDSQSEISKLNNANGSEVELSDDTSELLKFALDMCRQTDGMLDITIYPILKEWGFTTKRFQVPSEEEIAEAIQNIDYKKVILTGNTISIPENVALDFGAVAKGYVSERISELLKKQGITSAIINLGGNIQLLGSKPDGSDFKISVQHPSNRDSLGILELSEQNIATSNDTERFFEDADGKRYGHIINPKTGKPVENDLVSVVVISNCGGVSDALSTALYVMGKEKAIEYWYDKQNFEMLLLTRNDELYVTSVLEKQFKINDEYQSLKKYVIDTDNH